MEEKNECRTRGAAIPKWKGRQLCLFDSTRKCGNIIFLDEDLDRMSVICNMTLHVADHAYKEYQHDCSEPPPGVDGDQWVEMLEYWDNPKTKVAEKNKYNRDLKTMNHTTGSKTFARTSMESQIQSIVESREEDTFEVRTQIYVEQMRSETRNRMVSYASSSGARYSRKSSKGALGKVVAENNELKRKEEEASRKLAEVKAELEKSKTSQEQPPAPAYPMQHMPFQPQWFQWWIIPRFVFGLLSSNFDGDMLRYLGAHGGLAEGFGSQGGSAEGPGAQGGSAEGSGSIK
ncbi:hypothetical protein D8674_039868 [Pyrus ussuriensis x Pyrus communis]|uniref:Uncharacterized protein n=1 Tax=Pyrus ussuriensis x Pyrus communis TaxID=2448454 RepID=A0A5N5H1U2_9ROSA|nr:hypothetical protein D8674_039868 [Pyrus ussuriensis x Pyrus communis]